MLSWLPSLPKEVTAGLTDNEGLISSVKGEKDNLSEGVV